MNTKLAGALTLILGGAVASAPHTSMAATGDVAVSVAITSGITILYYDATLNVTVDASTLAASVAPPCVSGGPAGTYNCGDATAQSVTATYAGGTLTAPFAIATTPAPGGTPAAMPLLLTNVWAVRAIGGANATTVVTATLGTNTTLTNPAGGTIVLNPLIGVGTGVAAPALVASPASTPAFADPGLANPISGSVILSLNLTNATKTGTYTGAGAQQYTIAVTAT